MESLVATMARRFVGSDIVLSVVTLSGRVGRVGESVRSYLDQYRIARQWPVASMLWPRALAAEIHRTQADVVHLHSGAWYKGALAARIAGTRFVVYTEHGREHHDPPINRWIDRRASRQTDVVVAVSERLRAYLERRVGVEPQRLCTIENGVDTDAFVPGPPSAQLRRELGIPAEGLVVGSIGRLEPVKAYDRLISAIAALNAVRPGGLPVFLLIAGDGSDRARLASHAAALGVTASVRLTGWTDRPADFYRLFDVFALTSVSEGASVSLLEAMACGAAPVVMDVGANATILGPELQRQVVPAGDVAAFVAAAERTLGSPAERARIGAAARRRVERRFSITNMLDAYERLYRGEYSATPGAPRVPPPH